MLHAWVFAPVSAIPTWLCMGVDNGSVDKEERQTYVHIEQVTLQSSHLPTHSSSPVASDSHRTHLLHGYTYVRGYLFLHTMATIVGRLSMLSFREMLLDGLAQELMVDGAIPRAECRRRDSARMEMERCLKLSIAWRENS